MISQKSKNSDFFCLLRLSGDKITYFFHSQKILQQIPPLIYKNIFCIFKYIKIQFYNFLVLCVCVSKQQQSIIIITYCLSSLNQGIVHDSILYLKRKKYLPKKPLIIFLKNPITPFTFTCLSSNHLGD